MKPAKDGKSSLAPANNQFASAISMLRQKRMKSHKSGTIRSKDFIRCDLSYIRSYFNEIRPGAALSTVKRLAAAVQEKPACYNLRPMPSLLRPVAAWIAIACMAIGSLLPLASQAAAKSSPEMAICSTSASWQSPTGAPGQMAHAHCLYCSGGQPFHLDFPDGNTDAFHAALVYSTTPAPQRVSQLQRLREDSWARAPPV